MNPTIIATAMVVLAYLIGGIPFGVLLARRRGVDLRMVGSGNIGATNVGRVLGRRWGLLCLSLDILKGLLPTGAAGAVLLAYMRPSAAQSILWVAVGLAAVLGHVYPVYLGFRGGKGVATTIGVGLGLFPYFTYPMLAALGCYVAARLISGYVSVGSLVLAVSLPCWLLLFAIWRDWPGQTYWPLLGLALAVAGLIVLRHRDNIARLVRGQELRAGPGEHHPAC